MTNVFAKPLLGVVLVGLLVAACDDSSDGGGAIGSSGVASSKPLISLSDAEKGQLCDWTVAKAGSYGTPGTCNRTQPAATYPFLAYDDQADCVEDQVDATDTNCQATVAQFEACVNALPMCATLTVAASTPACAAIGGC